MKLIIITISCLILFGCQTQAKENNTTQNNEKKAPGTSKETFEIKAGREMVQFESKKIHKGYMYTFTNNGISPDSDDIKKRIISVEIDGKQEPLRLKELTPNECSEISHTDSVINDYRTWVDIVVCPYYEGLVKNKGLLMINKSIQGTEKFFGATLYKTIPNYTNYDIKSYHELNLSEAETQDIERFIKKTEIVKLDRDDCCNDNVPSKKKFSLIAAYSLTARHFVAHKQCNNPLNKFYITALFMTTGTDMKSESHKQKLKVFMDRYKNESKRIVEESSLESMCQIYTSQTNDDIKTFLNTLSLDKPTSDIQDKGLLEVTNAYEARDECGYKVSDEKVESHMKEHNLDLTDVSKGSPMGQMFYYYGIKANLDMNKAGRSTWCEKIRATNKILLPH